MTPKEKLMAFVQRMKDTVSMEEVLQSWNSFKMLNRGYISWTGVNSSNRRRYFRSC